MTDSPHDELQLTHDELLQAFDTAELVSSQLDELARATDDVALYRARDHARRAAGCLGAALAALQLHRQPRQDGGELLFGIDRAQLPGVPDPARHRAADGDDPVTVEVQTLAGDVLVFTDSSNEGPVWQQVDTRARPTVDEVPPTVELPRIDVDDLATTELPLLAAYGLAGAVESRDLGRC